MYRLLVVDDEPDIADGLYRMFMDINMPELDVYKAYSGVEAMEWLDRTKVDIVLTDIRMPGMSGLQLLERIRENWPDCKVIFLTGYNEFEYVYTAIKHEGVNYLLKTEGHEEIVKAVEKAIGDIEKSLQIDNLIIKAQKKMSAVLPLLKHEYLLDMIAGDCSPESVSKKQFEELGISLDPHAPVLLLLGRIDNLPGGLSSVERSRLYCSVRVASDRYLDLLGRSEFVAYDFTRLLWVIQPFGKELAEGAVGVRPAGSKEGILLKGVAESIQSVCKETLKLSLSFAVDGEFFPWEEISSRYGSLKMLLSCHMGNGEDMVVTDSKKTAGEFAKSYGVNALVHGRKAQIRRLASLETYLEIGQMKEFHDLLDNIAISLKDVKSKHYNPALVIFYSISMIFLSYINQWNLTEKLAFKIGMSKLTHIEEHGSWNDALQYFHMLADIIFELQNSEEEIRTVASVNMIKNYIHSHLNEDLSLVRLSELVYFNPSYLSRFFKKITGTTLISYINDIRLNKAKELLENTGYKINEIATAVGYESASYFTQFFRKATNMSPQEYRDAILNKGRRSK